MIGGGNIGGTMAHLCALKKLGDVVLFDVVDGLPQGKALDLLQSAPIEGFDVDITGATRYEDIVGADVCIVTAGIARKPGMSRDDLLGVNARIMTQVSEGIRQYAPDAFVIVITNPLDAMVTLCRRVTGFPRNRVVGQSGILDSSRYRTFIARELGRSVESVTAMVLGGHGDDMVPVRSTCRVGGMPVDRLIPSGRLDEIEQRVRMAGGEIVGLLKTGSAFYAPSAAVAQMVDSIALDKKRILPCAALLDGQYGIDGLYIGVPVVLGSNGIERILEISLTSAEQGMLKHSADAVRELVDSIQRLSSQ